MYLIQVLITGILIGGVYSLVSLPVVMIYKSSKIFNFAQGSIVMGGAWIAWYFMDPSRGLGLPWPIGILFTLSVAIITGMLIERLCLRNLIGQPLFATMIVTLGLGAIITGIITGLWGQINGESYPPFIPLGVLQIGALSIPIDSIIVFSVAIALIGLFSIFFKYHPYGLAMRSVAEDHLVSEALGIKVTTILQMTWAIGCLITFLSGILLASISSVSHTLDSIALVCFVVILMGGLESIAGVLIAGPIVGIIEQLTAQYLDRIAGGGLMQVMPFVILILVVLIRPYGIFGLERIERI
jgi:branched-chain amino acid transport system permease protein